jgi:hypothetical protein
VVASSDEEVCKVECVKSLDTLEQLDAFFASVAPDSLVVLDLYKTSCGACR